MIANLFFKRSFIVRSFCSRISKEKLIDPPVISLKGYFEGNPKEKLHIAKEIFDAGSTLGFFYVKD